MYDTVIRNGHVVCPDGVKQLDIGVNDGVITALDKNISSDSKETLLAEGLTVFPGLLDPHVHFNEPGRTEWETAATGSRAFAAGGGSLFFDMPLNSSPCLLTPADFEAKRKVMEKSAYTDYGLWGGLTPINLDRLEELAACGVMGFKAFRCSTGIQDLPNVDNKSLRAGMEIIAKLGLPLMVHCESDELTAALSKKAMDEGRYTARDYLDSRPIEAELESITEAINIAGATGCKLMIAHVSSVQGVELITAARKKGVDVYCETTASYLALNEDDVIRMGAIAKCSPPLRTEANRQGMWEKLDKGEIHFVSSDHSPCSPDLKAQPFMKAWGGIAGCQTTLNCLLTEGCHKRGSTPELLAKATAATPAAAFGVQGKGAIALGMDCDLAFVDMKAKFTLEKEDLLYKHPMSPYIGYEFQGKVVRTLLRGATIFKDGKIIGNPGGKMVRLKAGQ